MASRCVNLDEPVNSEIGIDQYETCPLDSLQNSLKYHLQSVRHLKTALADAMENCIKSPHGLTQDESAAIYFYTIEMAPAAVYAIVNDLLRDNDAMNAQPWFSYLKLLSTGLSKLPLYRGNVWRGVRGNVTTKYKKGQSIRWWSFTSCTTSLSIIEPFLPKKGQGTIFMIECATGRPISNYSKFKTEDEILLMPGIRLTVTDILPHGDIYMVHLKEIITNHQSKKSTSPKPILASYEQPSKTNPKSVSHHASKQLTSASLVVNMTKPSPKLTNKHPTPPPLAHLDNWKNTKNSSEVKKVVHCPSCTKLHTLKMPYRAGCRIRCSACSEVFNEVSCPECHSSNYWKDGDYHACALTTCSTCSAVFQHLECPHCDHATFWRNKVYIQGTKIRCSSCSGIYRALNCPHCQSVHYFKEQKYHAGKSYHCGSCDHMYQTFNCPHCSQLNVWLDGDRKQGITERCWSCKGTYQLINCPHCSKPRVWKDADRHPGVKCTCSGCDRIFQQLNCPKCLKSRIWTTTGHASGLRTTCSNCKTTSQHLNCPHCQAENVWLNGTYKCRQRVTCSTCNNDFQHSICPNCEKSAYFKKANLTDDSGIHCSGCDKSY